MPILVSILGLALAAGLALGATPAQPPPAPSGPAPDAPRARIRERIVEKLELSADQQKKIDELRALQRAEVQALAANKDLAPDARREKARAIMENYRAQIHAVLTPDQQARAGEWRENLGRGADGGGPGHRFGPGRGQGPQGPGMQPAPANPLAIIAMADRIKDRMADELQLTAEQRDKLERMGRDFRAQQRALEKKHQEEMRAVLTPEQQAKAEKMKANLRHRFGDPSGPHGPAPGMPENPPPPPPEN